MNQTGISAMQTRALDFGILAGEILAIICTNPGANFTAEIARLLTKKHGRPDYANTAEIGSAIKGLEDGGYVTPSEARHPTNGQTIRVYVPTFLAGILIGVQGVALFPPRSRRPKKEKALAVKKTTAPKVDVLSSETGFLREAVHAFAKANKAQWTNHAASGLTAVLDTAGIVMIYDLRRRTMRSVFELPGMKKPKWQLLLAVMDEQRVDFAD